MLDFSWNIANLVLASAGDHRRRCARGDPDPCPTGSDGVAPRLFAVLVGFAGLVTLHCAACCWGTWTPSTWSSPRRAG